MPAGAGGRVRSMKRLILAVITTVAVAAPAFAQTTTSSTHPTTTTGTHVNAHHTAGVTKHRAARKTGKKHHSGAHHTHKAKPATKS
jgi:Ni/Co efflux regulator RcnB